MEREEQQRRYVQGSPSVRNSKQQRADKALSALYELPPILCRPVLHAATSPGQREIDPGGNGVITIDGKHLQVRALLLFPQADC